MLVRNVLHSVARIKIIIKENFIYITYCKNNTKNKIPSFYVFQACTKSICLHLAQFIISTQYMAVLKFIVFVL